MVVLLSFLAARLLALCNDVELNPGPGSRVGSAKAKGNKVGGANVFESKET